VQLVRVGERLLFVADNGRYVFSGPAFDLWHGARLEAFDQAVALAQRIDLARLKLDPAALGALDLGTGPRDVVAFVDPLCPHCRTLLATLPALADRYRFRLVPLPVLGKGSQSRTQRSVRGAATSVGLPCATPDKASAGPFDVSGGIP
jgi:hypothetical protein